MSGLKMNNDKTKLIWIGSKKNYQVQVLRDRNFYWDSGSLTVLQIRFPTNTDQINAIN